MASVPEPQPHIATNLELKKKVASPPNKNAGASSSALYAEFSTLMLWLYL